MNKKIEGVASPRFPRVPRWLGQAFAVLAACVLLLSLSTCIGNDRGAPPIHGVLLQQGSNNPLAGAIAVARWEGSTGFGGGCFHVDTAITDSEGKFVIPAWQFSDLRTRLFGVVFHGGTGFPKFYLRGYKQIIDNVTLPLGRADGANIRTFFMELDFSTAPERLQRLGSLSNWCSMDDGGNLSTNRLNQALYEEAKEIATTSELDQQFLRRLLKDATGPFRNTKTPTP